MVLNVMWWTVISGGPPPRLQAISFTPPPPQSAANLPQLTESCLQHPSTTCFFSRPRIKSLNKIDFLMTNS